MFKTWLSRLTFSVVFLLLLANILEIIRRKMHDKRIKSKKMTKRKTVKLYDRSNRSQLLVVKESFAEQRKQQSNSLITFFFDFISQLSRHYQAIQCFHR